MADGTKTYDYAVLNDCINQMKSANSQIEEQAMDLAKQVQNLMGTWSGSTATQYNGMADDLKKELDQSNANLELTRVALQQGSDHMGQTDQSGTKSFSR